MVNIVFDRLAMPLGYFKETIVHFPFLDANGVVLDEVVWPTHEDSYATR